MPCIYVHALNIKQKLLKCPNNFWIFKCKNGAKIYYTSINNSSLELFVFWPTDTESLIKELSFSDYVSLSFKTRLTLVTCFCGDVM